MTSELHVPNAYYGHASVLKRYAGLPQQRSLKVAVEHGIPIVRQVWTEDVQAAMPVFLCATEERARAYSALVSNADAVAIGPMIHYAEPLADPQPPTGRLLAFPAHSTHHIAASWDPRAFADRLLRERGDWDEIVVCVYWRDVQAGLHRAFEDAGLRCVTAGHIYDQSFLARLRTIIESAEAVITNEVGSHLLYAVCLERPVRFIPQEIEYLASADVLERDAAAPRHWQEEPIRRMRELFTPESRALTDEQRRFVATISGRASCRTRDELKDVLRLAEERYRQQHPLGRRTYRSLRSQLRLARDRLVEQTSGRRRPPT